MNESKELEREAIALWRRYGFMLPSTVRAFLARLAGFLEWDQLKGVMRG